MKNIIALFFCLSLYGCRNENDVHVNGYYRKDGTYVRSHYRTSPDVTTANNYSNTDNIRVGLLLLPIVLVGLAIALKDNKQNNK